MGLTRLAGTFTTEATGTLRDLRTARSFCRDLLNLLQGEALAEVATDVGMQLRQMNQEPTPEEVGILCITYASLAGVLVRTQPELHRGRIEVHSWSSAIEPPAVHALLYRHYWTRDADLRWEG